MSESFALVRKYGVLPEVFYGVLTDGLFACGAYKAYGKIIAEERYLPAGHRVVMGLKDAGHFCRCRSGWRSLTKRQRMAGQAVGRDRSRRERT